MNGGGGGPEPCRVLVVDEHPDFARNLEELIAGLGHKTHRASTLAVAESLVTAGRFEVVVLDQRMTEGSGSAFLRWLQDREPDTVAVMVTGYASLDPGLRPLDAGAFAYVAKDTSAETLCDVLSRAFQHACLHRENRRLRSEQIATLQAIPDLLVLVDEHLQVVRLNQRHELLCRLDPDEAPGARLSDLWTEPAARAVDWSALLEHVRRGGKDSELSIDLPRGEGGTATFGIRVQPVVCEEQTLFLLRVVELTERLELEHRLSESESLATLGRLASSVAHEIRNPIAGIRVLVQMLTRRRELLEGEEENVEEIFRLLDRMGATVSDLLDYASPVAERERAFTWAQVLEVVERDLARGAKADGVQIRFEPSEEVSADWGVPERLQAALGNLVENALHACAGSGLVRVRVVQDSERSGVVVEDSGPGISAEDRPFLFQPFFTNKTRGSGLGLSIVKRIAEQHKGGVDFDHSPDLGGARFVLWISRRRTAHPLAPLVPGGGVPSE